MGGGGKKAHLRTEWLLDDRAEEGRAKRTLIEEQEVGRRGCLDE